MIKYAGKVFTIIIGLALLGCSNSEKGFLKASNVSICSHQMSLGKHIKGNLLSENYISYKPEVDAYYITCDKPGTFIVGNEVQRIRFEVEEVTFSLDPNSCVDNIVGIWVPNKENRATTHIHEVQSKIEAFLGEKAATEPFTWKESGLSLYVGRQQMDLGMMSYVQLTN